MAGANDDDDYTSDCEEATIKYSFPDRKSMKKISNEELLVIVSKGIACLPSCGTMSCDCLNILADVNVRECVAQYLLQFVRKSKYDQDSIVLEWYTYAIAARIDAMISCRKPLRFCLPYNATLNTDIDCLRASQKHRLCLLGMRSLLGIGDFRYRSIRAAVSIGVMPRHKGAGKKSNMTIKHDDPHMIHLRNHFDYLHMLGEVRATKVIATVVDGAHGLANPQDTDRNIYLPISMGYRNYYNRYMGSLGYKVTVGTNGSLKADGADGTENAVALSTYYTKWKADYPSLKVSRPAQDICYYCYTFGNKHKILSNDTKNTRPADGEGDINDEEVIDFDDNENIRELAKILDNTHLDKLDSASSKVEEAKEFLIKECSDHIDMARMQRFLYQSMEAAAVSDAKNGIEYSKRRTTLTVDFGQNIQVPCYNSEQPGCTYYYTPMTANNFGIVNHSHDNGNGNIDNHTYGHVYHEGVGKKSGTNVASLIVKTLREMKLL